MHNCEIFRQQLVDLAYGEGEETPELRSHLETCSECAQYWAQLQDVQLSLNHFEIEEEPGFAAVKKVMRHAYEVRERKSLIIDLIKFAGVVVMILCLYYLLYEWQGLKGLLVVQGVIFLTVPLSLIPLTKIQVDKRR